jgi:hypothetical protein
MKTFTMWICVLTHPKLLDGFNYEVKGEVKKELGHALWLATFQG